MQIINQFIDIIIHLDIHLVNISSQYGLAVYAILFFVILAETGFVVTPFLPGDSLIFAAGALSAVGSLNIILIIALLATAAILGDTANYWIGHFLGKKIVATSNFPLIKKKHIEKTERFFEKYGGKAIILARFVPIVRTFAPFVAGVGTMHYKKFITFNFIGGLLWVFLFALAGFFFGNIPFIKENFHYVILVIIGISVLPMVVEFAKSKAKKIDRVEST